MHGALDWAAEHDPALAVDLAMALWPYWDLRWRERFAISYLTKLLDRLGRCDDRGERAWTLTVIADLAANPGEVRLARTPAEQAIVLFRDLGERPWPLRGARRAGLRPPGRGRPRRGGSARGRGARDSPTGSATPARWGAG